MSRTWSSGSTRAWRTLRAHILARDRFRCRAHDEGWCERARARRHECQIRVTLSGPGAGHAHHTKGKAVTGDDPLHIVAACGPCNQAIGEPAEPDACPAPRTRWL